MKKSKPQTKEQCVRNLLEDKFGFLLADVVIPEFSVYSVANNLQAVGVGVAVSPGLKAALSSGPIAYGKCLGSQGTFLADYS